MQIRTSRIMLAFQAYWTLLVAQKISKPCMAAITVVIILAVSDIWVPFFTEIVAPPQSVNITLNKVAVINCTSTAPVILWEIDGYGVQQFSNITESETETVQNLHTRKLWVTGSPDNDGVQVVCLALLYVNGELETKASEPALIRVQGIGGGLLLCIFKN